MSYDPIGVMTGGGDGATGASATQTLTLPAGASAGDRVIVHSTVITSSATATIASGSGGWTLLSGPTAGGSGTTTTSYVWTKLLTAGDIGAPVVVTWTASVRGLSVGIVYPPGTIGEAGTFAYTSAFGGQSSIALGTVDVVTNGSFVIIASGKANSGNALATISLPAGYTQDTAGATNAAAATNYNTALGHKAIVTTGTAGGETVTFSAANNGATAFAIALSPPPPPNEPPSVTVSGNQNVAAGSTVALTSSATDTDGTIVSRAWTFDYPASGAPALTGGTTANPTFTAGSAGALYVLRCTVTDDDGATAFATTEVRVPLVASTYSSRPIAGNGTAVGAWVNTGGAATGGAALADESDSTYLESPALTATETTYRVRCQPVATSSGVTIPVKLALDTAVAATVKVRLFENTTLRQEWVQAVTTAPTTYTLTLTNPSAISDWGKLFLEIGATS